MGVSVKLYGFWRGWFMKNSISVPATVKQIEKRIMKCKNCLSVTECSIYSAQTDIKIIGIKIKNIHKHDFAVCPECKTAFYI